MNYNKVADEEWRTLQNAADLLGVSVLSLLGLPRDDPPHAIVFSGSGPAEQYQLIQDDPPDPTLIEITGLGLQGQELSIGSHPGLFDLPLPNDAVQLEENHFSPWCLWPSAYDPPALSEIANPCLISFSTGTELPYQPQLDDLSLKPATSSLANRLNFTFRDFEPTEQIYPHDHFFTASLHEEDNRAVTAQAPSHVQRATRSRLPGSVTSRNRHVSASRTKGPTSRRKCLSPEDRDQTAFTRKIRGCMQCRQNRKRCTPDKFNPDPEAWCLSCQRSTPNSISRLPCLRYKIVDSWLYRTNNHTPAFEPLPLTGPNYGGFCAPKIWVANSPIKTLDLTQGHGTALHLRVREFTPPEDDDGRLDSRGRSIYAVPWALVDAEDAVSSVRAFIEESVDTYLDRYARDFDEITRLVIGAARDRSRAPHCEERPLFRDLLHFWTAARFIEGGWRCCGPETLDADKLPDPLNPPSLVAPPPYIDFQLAAVVMERVLKPLQKRILVALEKLVLAGRARNWFHIFLVIFVLLQGYELVFAHEVAWTWKRRYPTRYADANRILRFHEGAKILLAHFHHACKGGVPFGSDFDWSCPSARSMTELSAKELDLVLTLVSKTHEKERDVHISRVSDRPDLPLWYSGQMFEAGWTPKYTDEHAPPIRQ